MSETIHGYRKDQISEAVAAAVAVIAEVRKQPTPEQRQAMLEAWLARARLIERQAAAEVCFAMVCGFKVQP